jgi:DNA-binding NarL/FixJ family response regulator
VRTVSIIVADDHPVVRHGVRSLLEINPGWRVVGQARDGREAIHLARRLKPDLVVLDIGMPLLNGLDAARRIAKDLPETRLLILSMYDSEELIEKALDSGAHGFVRKSEAESELVAAARAVLNDKVLFPPQVSLALPQRRIARRGCRGTQLTARERELIQLIAEGNSNKEAASILGISRRTVENHRANIMRKLGIRSFSELIRYAVRNRFVAA